jgi:hypothetical protein
VEWYLCSRVKAPPFGFRGDLGTFRNETGRWPYSASEQFTATSSAPSSSPTYKSHPAFPFSRSQFRPFPGEKRPEIARSSRVMRTCYRWTAETTRKGVEQWQAKRSGPKKEIGAEEDITSLFRLSKRSKPQQNAELFRVPEVQRRLRR